MSWLAAAGFGAALALAPGAADAQDHAATGGRTVAPERRVGGSPVLFSADEVTYDDELGIVIARGNVEMSQSGRTLLADVVSYNEHTDTVTATGHVSLIENATGQTTFASYVELHDDMRDGFVKDVRMLLADRSRLAGNTARRSDANLTELRKGVYSPCDLCKDDPSAPPLWQLKAAQITHDSDQKLVEYHDVTLEIDGVPVLWSPYLSHPDPSVKRKSGFLAPTVGSNTVLGGNATIPYYWVLGPDKDLVVAPLLTTNQGVVLGGDYRERFADGILDIKASVTDSDPNLYSTGSHNSQLRGNIFATGAFDIDAEMRAGFDIERASDILYLQEYKYSGYQNFLDSSAFLEDFIGRNYGSIYAYDFQSMQLGVEDRTQPIVLPVADYTWAGRPTDWGGRFTTSLDMLDLIRETGANDQRVSVGERFDLPFQGPLGERFNFLATVRGDNYYVQSQPLVANGPLTDGLAGRVYPQIGLEWRDPWIRRDGNSTWLIEPRIAFYAAPVGMNPAKIPNDDSEGVDFNDTDLFTPNRFMGFDQVDSGQRVDYGVHAAWYGGGDSGADVLIGQSYRFQKESPFAINGAGDGLEYQTSDYVGRMQFTPNGSFDVAYRFRFDERSLQPQRQEVSTTFGPLAARISLSYLQLGNNLHDLETARQQVGTTMNFRVNDYWSVTLNGTRDIAGDGHLLAAGIGARYSDECATFIATLGQDGTVIGNYRPGTTLLFQLVLKNLGEIAAPSIQTGLGGS